MKNESHDKRMAVLLGAILALLGLQAFAAGLKANQLDEITPGNGVSIDGVKLKDGYVELSDISPPSPSTRKLYSSSGDLYWNGAQLNGGGGGGGASIYGDGSAGDLTVNSATNWATTPPANNNTRFANVAINNTLIVPSGTKIYCTGNFTIGNGGSIVVQTYSGPGSPGLSPDTPNIKGAVGIGSNFQAALILKPDLAGGGGGQTRHITYGNGGYGGGALLVLCQGNIAIQAGGSIAANGGDANYVTSPGVGILGHGGGGGGVVVLASPGSISINGSISVNGGNGCQGYDGNGGSGEGGGGGGGGGIVHIVCPNSVATSNVAVSGGSGASGPLGTGGTSAGGGGGACGGSGGDGGLPGAMGAVGNAGRIVQTLLNPEVVY